MPGQRSAPALGASHILRFSWCWIKCRYFVSEVLILKLVFRLQSFVARCIKHAVTSILGNTVIHRSTVLGSHWVFAAFHLSIGSVSWWWRNTTVPKHVVVRLTQPYSCVRSRNNVSKRSLHFVYLGNSPSHELSLRIPFDGAVSTAKLTAFSRTVSSPSARPHAPTRLLATLPFRCTQCGTQTAATWTHSSCLCAL